MHAVTLVSGHRTGCLLVQNVVSCVWRQRIRYSTPNFSRMICLDLNIRYTAKKCNAGEPDAPHRLSVWFSTIQWYVFRSAEVSDLAVTRLESSQRCGSLESSLQCPSPGLDHSISIGTFGMVENTASVFEAINNRTRTWMAMKKTFNGAAQGGQGGVL